MQTHQLRVVALAAATLVASGVAAPAADHLVSGTVASAAGEKLGGVTVSAKAHGSTITTSVYTDEQGGYYFPPLPAGTYTVWAQALAFELAKGEVDLTAARRADLTLKAMTDVERQVRQMPGEMLMAALRDPESGCPWDRKQTFATIAPYTIEEAYEVADAIERGAMDDLKEELGDLLLQVVYHARMAEEKGAFAFPDVAEAISTKMIRRHPHVFGEGPGDGGAHQW